MKRKPMAMTMIEAQTPHVILITLAELDVTRMGR
jgi:hypothetical protein